MYSGPIIDCDVHHTWKKRTDLTQYLPREWRRYADGQGLLAPVFPAYRNRHRDAKRVDAWPPDGSPPGSDYQTLRTQLLDPLAVRRALLLFDTGTNAGHPNMYFATELVEAMNRWTVDYWLDGVDDRLFGGLLVPVQQPDEAAKVIRSKGQNERFATVLLNWNPGTPFGHPVYHPIYEAAQEMALSVSIHVGVQGNGHWLAGGMPASRAEFMTLMAQPMQHHLVSMIAHGVFERFPALKVNLLEVGVGWVPWLMWAMDAHLELLRSESPWVRRRPSEYFLEHCAVTTQPLEESPRPQQLVDLLTAFDGIESVLCFASDYPHWDADAPSYIANRLPGAWREKIFWSNPDRMHRWPDVAEPRADGQTATVS